MKGSASMGESTGSHFKTTMGIQSGPDIFEKSRLVMTLTKFGVTWTLCSFRLVLKAKAGKAIPESSRFEFLDKYFVNSFALSEADENTLGSLNRGGIAYSPLLRTQTVIHQKWREPFFWEVTDSFVLLH